MSEIGIEALSVEERQKCEVWTRVMGYHRPVSEFNPGKQSEHKERTHFLECCAGLHQRIDTCCADTHARAA